MVHGLLVNPHSLKTLNNPSSQTKANPPTACNPFSLCPQVSRPLPCCHTSSSCPTQPSTFLQCLSLARGEDSPIPVAGPWMGTSGSLTVTVETGKSWSQNSCKGGQCLTAFVMMTFPVIQGLSQSNNTGTEAEQT